MGLPNKKLIKCSNVIITSHACVTHVSYTCWVQHGVFGSNYGYCVMGLVHNVLTNSQFMRNYSTMTAIGNINIEEVKNVTQSKKSMRKKDRPLRDMNTHKKILNLMIPIFEMYGKFKVRFRRCNFHRVGYFVM